VNHGGKGKKMNGSLTLKQFFTRLSWISLVKAIGACGRIPLFRMVGAEGVGLYQIAYSFYALALTMITVGLPTILSQITSTHPKQGVRLLSLSALLLAIVGGIFGYFTYSYTALIINIYGDANLTWAIRSFTPAFIIVPLLSLIRGFLQGTAHYSRLLAISELMEQIIRVAIMLLLVSLWLEYGIDYAIGGATLAAAIGAICTLCFLMSSFVKMPIVTQQPPVAMQAQKLANPQIQTLLKTSLFILATRLIIPLSNFIDSLLIPHRLQAAGMSMQEATATLGEFSGMAAMIVYIPTFITSAFSHILAPQINLDLQSKKLHQLCHRVKKSLTLGWLWGISSAFLLMFYSQEISTIIAGNHSLADSIFYMSFAPLFAGVNGIATTTLWAMQEEKKPLFGLMAGATCSVLINYFMVGMAGFEHIGVVLGLISVECVSSICNLSFLYVKLNKLTM
jgi:stage V sporulation protein B